VGNCFCAIVKLSSLFTNERQEDVIFSKLGNLLVVEKRHDYLEKPLGSNAEKAHTPRATGQKGIDGQMLVTAQAKRHATPKPAPIAIVTAAMIVRMSFMGIKKKGKGRLLAPS
jgi:hypothetical protein